MGMYTNLKKFGLFACRSFAREEEDFLASSQLACHVAFLGKEKGGETSKVEAVFAGKF